MNQVGILNGTTTLLPRLTAVTSGFPVVGGGLGGLPTRALNLIEAKIRLLSGNFPNLIAMSNIRYDSVLKCFFYINIKEVYKFSIKGVLLWKKTLSNNLETSTGYTYTISIDAAKLGNIVDDADYLYINRIIEYDVAAKYNAIFVVSKKTGSQVCRITDASDNFNAYRSIDIKDTILASLSADSSLTYGYLNIINKETGQRVAKRGADSYSGQAMAFKNTVFDSNSENIFVWYYGWPSSLSTRYRGIGVICFNSSLGYVWAKHCDFTYYDISNIQTNQNRKLIGQDTTNIYVLSQACSSDANYVKVLMVQKLSKINGSLIGNFSFYFDTSILDFDWGAGYHGVFVKDNGDIVVFGTYASNYSFVICFTSSFSIKYSKKIYAQGATNSVIYDVDYNPTSKIFSILLNGTGNSFFTIDDDFLNIISSTAPVIIDNTNSAIATIAPSYVLSSYTPTGTLVTTTTTIKAFTEVPLSDPSNQPTITAY